MKRSFHKRIASFLESLVGNEREIKERLEDASCLDVNKISKELLKKNKLFLLLLCIAWMVIIYISISSVLEKSELSRSIKEKQMILRDENLDKNLDLSVFTQDINKKTIKEESVNFRVRSQAYIKEKDESKKNDIFGKDIRGDLREIQNILREVEENNKSTIALPDRMKDGRKLVWAVKDDFTWILFIVAPIGFLVILKKYKYYEIIKLEKKLIRSITKDLPTFINKLVLLLSTGIIFERAFKIAVENYGELVDEENYFYRELKNIIQVHDRNNEDIVELLYGFAKRSKVRDLVRVVNIIWDNVSKGDKLVDKLQLESELLWFSQKKDMEERGRLSEGKLIIPLIVMLIILVIITVAPAMIDI